MYPIGDPVVIAGVSGIYSYIDFYTAFAWHNDLYNKYYVYELFKTGGACGRTWYDAWFYGGFKQLWNNCGSWCFWLFQRNVFIENGVLWFGFLFANRSWDLFVGRKILFSKKNNKSGERRMNRFD